MDFNRLTTPLKTESPLVQSVNICVWDILRWLAAGKREAEIIAEHPGLDHEDFLAVYGYALLKGEFGGTGPRMRQIRSKVKRKLGR
jgi:hypothetical protein